MLAAALLIRVLYIVIWQNPTDYPLDGRYYLLGANFLAAGRGYVSPLRISDAALSAPGTFPVSIGVDHPPGFTTVLSVVSVLGWHSALAHQLWCAVLGVVTVLFVGLIGRRLGGDRAGLVAAGIASVYPAMWSTDAYLASETLAMLLRALAVYLAYRVLDRPSTGLAVALASVVAAAALTRAELVVPAPAPRRARPRIEWWKRTAARSVWSDRGRRPGRAGPAVDGVGLEQAGQPGPDQRIVRRRPRRRQLRTDLPWQQIGDWNYMCSGRGANPKLDQTIIDQRARTVAFREMRRHVRPAADRDARVAGPDLRLLPPTVLGRG